MDITSFLIVLIVGLIGGFFNTFVGAGSLVSIPALIFLGLPPTVAIASNRLGVTGSDIADWYQFHIKEFIDYKIGMLLAVPSLIGSIIGANLVLEFNEVLLKRIIAAASFIILMLIIFNPGAGIKQAQKNLKGYHYASIIFLCFIIGIYGGFYGAGAGTFLFYILILIAGETFLQSAGTRVMANLSFSLMAAGIFAYNGVINYSWTVPLFIGSFVGSFISAHYSDRIGNVWIKRLFLVVVLIMVVKLLI